MAPMMGFLHHSIELIKIKVYKFTATKSISRIKIMLILCPDARP
jgi:hypothetical protein